METTNQNDMPSTGLNIISFLIPLVGLIVYLTQKEQFPKKANSAGKSALWGVLISIVLSVVGSIVAASMVASAVSSYPY
ncbi:MAG: hypothetical protein QNK85_04120 [Crocinitomicaceae bacterium]